MTFGVSGKLWKNALVMYDRQTKTLWSHLTGQAIAGPLKGQELDMVAAVPKLKWVDWKRQYPDSRVLSVEDQEDLRRDTYRDYHRSSRTGLFRPEHLDKRLRPKDLVLGVRVGGSTKAYPLNSTAWKLLRGRRTVIHDRVGDVPLLVYHDPDNFATAVFDRRIEDEEVEFEDHSEGHIARDSRGGLWNLLTGEGPKEAVLTPLPHVGIYWFAWVDFYPETELYNPKKAAE